MGQFRSLVQAAMGVKRTHRYREIGVAIVQGAATDHIPILTADDNPDYAEDFVANTSSPECETGSRILGIDLTLDLVPGAAGATIEWFIWKNPDASFTEATFIPSLLFTNDVSINTLAMRKFTMAYGRFLSTANKESSRTRVRITRAAMRRVGTMHQDDVLNLAFLHSAAAANGNFSIHGRIWTRK